jgi:hypothetical protein
MNSKALHSSLVWTSALLFATGAFAQTPKAPTAAASPGCTLKQRVGLTDIEIVYSRPGVKGRKIFGGLVPYGQVWRTGANEATRISFSGPVKVNGSDVPAGTYGLFTIPSEKEWTVILNKTPAQWGSFKYDPAADLVRVKTAATSLSEPVETFTIDINDIRNDSATLNFIWEKTRVQVNLSIEKTAMQK